MTSAAPPPSLRSRAEVLKLEHLLGTKAGELDYLQKAAPADLRKLREATTNMLFDGDRRLLQRVAVAAGRLPPPIVATISQRVFGPVLSARVAGLIDRKKALELALRVPVGHLAEIAVHIDPRRVADVIAQMPTDRSVAVARELDKRKEYVPMGRLVAHLGDQALLACLEAVSDELLLRIALLIEDEERLAHIISIIPDKRVERVVRVARKKELWPEAIALLRHVADDRRHLIANLADIQEPDVIAAIVDNAAGGDDWPALIPLIPDLPKKTQQLVADAVKRLDKSQRKQVTDHATELGILDQLGPVRKALKT